MIVDEEVRPPGQPPQELVPGLTDPRGIALERFLVRTRERAVTQAGWRLAVACKEGEGAIVFVEISSQETFHRGEGVFLGWPRERMEAAYRALLPKLEEPAFETQQLG